MGVGEDFGFGDDFGVGDGFGVGEGRVGEGAWRKGRASAMVSALWRHGFFAGEGEGVGDGEGDGAAAAHQSGRQRARLKTIARNFMGRWDRPLRGRRQTMRLRRLT